METRTAGLCPDCNQPNSYGKITCDHCGHRLPWADSFAAAMGEPCPQCATFNPYINMNCKTCAALLPWHNAMAPQRHATRNVEVEEKSTMALIIVCAFGAIVFFAAMLWFIAPR